MDEKELQEFDLEDIIKEFSDAPEQIPEATLEEQNEIQEENPADEQQPLP